MNKTLCTNCNLPSKDEHIAEEYGTKNCGENGLHRSVGRNNNWATFVVRPALEKEAQPWRH